MRKKYNRRMRAWRGFGSFFGALAAILIMVTLLANSYVRAINSFMGIKSTTVENYGDVIDDAVYTSQYDNIDDMMTAKLALIEESTDEGIVLLKNNGTLPLANVQKVTCLGRASTDLVYGGASGAGIIGNTGTGINATLKEGLEKAGFEVNPILWDFYAESEYSRGSGGSGGMEQYRLGEIPVSEYPENNGFTEYSDACIVVFARNSGESNEAPIGDFEDGSKYYQITETEKELLELAKNNFDSVIVFVNSPSALSVDELEKDDQIDAVLTAGGLGARGTYSLGKILNGTVNPSGHTSDTYAVDSTSSPAIQNSGDYTYSNADEIIELSNNGTAEHNTNYLVQAEGIYIGYKYYETRYEDCVLKQGNANSEAGTFSSSNGWNYEEEVTYSFGHGLSYTTFTQELEEVTVENDVITAKVSVTNTGDTAGKDVVEFYVQSPYTAYDQENGVEKSSIQLVNFAKTSLLAPGESESVILKMDLYNICSYDANGKGTWILDDGDYYFAIGSSAHDALNNILAAKGKNIQDGMDQDGNADLVSVWKNEEFRLFADPEFSEDGFSTYAGTTHYTTGVKVENQVQNADLNSWIPDAVTYLSRSDWEGTWPKSVDDLEATEEMLPHLLAVYEAGESSTEDIITGADTNYQVSMMIGKDYDDPDWELILNQMTYTEMMYLVGKDFSSTEPIPSIGYPGTTENDGPSGAVTNYSSEYDTGSTVFDDIEKYSSINPRMYASESLVACAFNQELAYRIGLMNGEDCYYTGQTTLWAPGINLHRTPYSGRNFEYFSEDSMVSYILGAQEVAGIQETGAVACPKHFVFNDYEMNRFGLSTFMNEQTARENGLRAFEGAIAVGHAKNVMTTLARVGVDWMGYSDELQNQVLRSEWGFDGFIVTDNAIMPYMYGNAITTGTDKFLVFLPGRYEKQLSEEVVKADRNLALAMREACHRILYVNVNSMAMNGITDNVVVKDLMPDWEKLLIGIDTVMIVLTVLCIWRSAANRKKYRREEMINE